MTTTQPDLIIDWGYNDTGYLFVAPNPDQFRHLRKHMADKLLQTEPFNAGKWQQLDVSGSNAHDTYELQNVTAWYEMPEEGDEAIRCIEPDLPWAEGHFQERVAGWPVNPGDWHDKWPYHANGAELHLRGKIYDHNYMERFWPTKLYFEMGEIPDHIKGAAVAPVPFTGYRFGVGDLDDVVRQLADNIGTRQAYLPIFFPEDTGATQGQRVPCTLGYHFMVRDGRLNLTYHMRSCEVYRHFTNDVYMAVRLAQWVRAFLHARGHKIDMGQLTMQIASFHGFVGDREKIEEFL